MSRDIQKFCAECVSCQSCASTIPHERAPLQSIHAERPFQRIAADITELPVTSHGNRYVLFVMDYFTRFVNLYRRIRVITLSSTESITTSYYRNSVGGLLVFDLTNRKTFDHVREWHREVTEHVLPYHMVYILIGHKSDLEHDRKVSREEAEQLAADLGIRYVETSAKRNTNVERAFQLLTRDIYELMKMGEIDARDGWEGVKAGLSNKVLYPAEEEAERERSCRC
uniref:RAB42, member RAS oncogene family a n=1 Tax=Paramormyrops kingsleyae TaxID=1676925 RepID=A0A3B3SU10_9TELE